MTARREPVVVGFLCSWCAYRAADLAGVTRTPYAPSFLPIKVICSGRVEPEMVLRALASGADGVLVLGCHPGGCHSVDGNVKAARRVELLRSLLEQLRVGEERVEVIWTGASEGHRLAEEVDRFVERIRKLGPLPRPAGRASGSRAALLLEELGSAAGAP